VIAGYTRQHYNPRFGTNAYVFFVHFLCYQTFAVLQLEVISLCIEIEKLVLEVHIVAQRCIKNYNDCETRNQRFKQFDELTSMLGDGRPPAVGKRGAVVLTCDPPRLLMQICMLVSTA
jgi:hypothetical protein